MADDDHLTPGQAEAGQRCIEWLLLKHVADKLGYSLAKHLVACREPTDREREKHRSVQLRKPMFEHLKSI